MSKFILCQGEKVLSVHSSLEEAENARKAEIERDFFSLLLKRSLIKKLLKKKTNFISDNYYIAEVISNEIPNGNFT